MRTKAYIDAFPPVRALIFLLLALAFVSVLAVPQKSISQSNTTPLLGYAWSDTIGWIDLNCENTGSCGVYDFGFEINSGSEITGYAWSDTIGWISAKGSDVAGCPSAPCSASIDGGQLHGWLRVLSAFASVESDPEEFTDTFTTSGADTFTVPDYETMTVKVWGAGGGGGSAVSGSSSGVGEYTGFSFDTAASGNDDPIGITWDGTYFWVTDGTDAEVYKYNAGGTYTGFSFDTAASGNGSPYGIAWDGASFWVTDVTDKEVYKYNADGTYTGFSFDTAASGNAGLRSIAWDGASFWVTDRNNAEVYKYNSNGTYTGFSFDTAASGNGSPYGIAWDGAYFWVADKNGKEVYQYNADGTYTGFSFDTDVSGSDTHPFGITWDGTYFWVVDNTDDEVYQYGGGTSGTPASGEDGGQSRFNAGTPVVAGGGSGGTGGESTLGTGGAGGSASGGDTNTAGGSGTDGSSSPYTGGAGGDSPSGGTGGAGGTGDSDGSAGGAPGAGGGGASYETETTAGGGGGAGAYSERTYSAGELTEGSAIDVTVGAGGAGGDDGGSGHSGAAGADGRVEITYTLTQSSETGSGGWDGWISLKGTSPNYGVVGTSTGAFVGFAWGSDVIGWVDFSLAYTEYEECAPVYFCSADDRYYRDQFCAETLVEACSYSCSAGACIPPPPPTPTESGNLEVNPSLVSFGQTTQVTWDVENADSCTVTDDPDIGDGWTGSSGNYTSSAIPTAVTYHLDCTGEGGELHETATVLVVPAWREF